MDAIGTERLTVRNFTNDDWEDLSEIITQYEACEYSDYDHQWPTSEDGVRGVAECFSSADSFLAVCLKSTGKLIGFITLNAEEECGSNVFSLGFVFNFDYHGQGYATEACRAIVDYAFVTLGAAAMISGTAAVNGPSRRLLERLGLRQVGEATGSLRESADGRPIEFRGLTYALPRTEWEISG